MDDTARGHVGAVNAPVQRQRFARTITRNLRARSVHQSQPGRVQLAQASVGGRDQIGATHAHADVAGRGVHITTRKQARTDAADFFALFGV